MKLVLKEKKLSEQEDEKLSTHKFSQDELNKRTEDLDRLMHRVAMPLQEKVPVQVANEYFLKYVEGDRVSHLDMKKSSKIGELADEQGLVRIADIFILAQIHNNIDLSWMLDKYIKG